MEKARLIFFLVVFLFIGFASSDEWDSFEDESNDSNKEEIQQEEEDKSDGEKNIPFETGENIGKIESEGSGIEEGPGTSGKRYNSNFYFALAAIIVGIIVLLVLGFSLLKGVFR